MAREREPQGDWYYLGYALLGAILEEDQGDQDQDPVRRSIPVEWVA